MKPGVGSVARQPDFDAGVRRNCREVAPAAGVIVFSGFDPAMMASDVLSRGADRYLEKGARPSEITAAIEEVAALGQPA